MTKRLTYLLAYALAVGILAASPVAAQGLQTGVLSGVVKDPDGLPVPGATVTATSPALQGERSAVTDEIGAYILRGLPPGTYMVRFELAGAATVEETAVVPLGGVAKVDPTLRLAGVTEAVTVTADVTPPPLATTQNSTNLRAEVLNTLPVGRRPFEIAELAPGVTDVTPNAGQIAISGALAFDSIFLIDGVDTNDNLFGSSNSLFIEDAIEETQVLVSGISAEFGRFGGGVVNVITRSGGNEFHGSFRTNLSRPSWTAETPFERERNQQRSEVLSKTYEATIGGPIVRDRLWFFNADRYEKSSTAGVFAEIGGSYTPTTDNKRFELKLTATPIVNQRFTGSFLNNPLKRTNLASINSTESMTPTTLVNLSQPNNLWVVNWNGVLTNKLFGTFQWSKKRQSILDAGGTSTAIVDSPFRGRGVVAGSVSGRHYNAPFFSANDPENRNNRQFTGSLASYVTNPRMGRHDLKVGFEHFLSYRTGGNSQSATGYVFQTDYLTAGGRPVVGPDGEPIPIWGGNAAVPTQANTRIQNWLSVQGAQLDIKTLSFYAQDHWTAGDRLSFDLGVRYEKVRTDATGGIVGADTDTIVPRLGASLDVLGDGRTVANVTFARYSGRFTERAFARNTNVGTPSLVTYAYIGPNGQGFDFAPGFNLNNYVVISGNFPTANVFFDENLTSPKTNEFTLALGHDFAGGSYAKALYTWRKATDFIEDFIDDPSPAGKVSVNQQGVTGTFDRVRYANTDVPRREYQALQFESRGRFTQRLFVEGHWTIQIRNHGNFEGEAANQPGNPSIWFDYPEIYTEATHYPFGRLNEFQRHKIRIWTSYNQDLGRFGNLDIGPVWRINSGQTYSLVATNVAHSAVQIAEAQALGYLRTNQSSADYYFAERGSENFKGYGLLDLQLRYGVPVWRTVQPWLLVQVYNVLNNQKLVQWTTTVTPDPASPLDENGLRTGFVRSAAFGTAGSAAHFPFWSTTLNGGRTFRLAFGVRF